MRIVELIERLKLLPQDREISWLPDELTWLYYNEPIIPYGKIVDLEDGNELWSESITDMRDGIVLRNQDGSIIATYIL